MSKPYNSATRVVPGDKCWVEWFDCPVHGWEVNLLCARSSDAELASRWFTIQLQAIAVYPGQVATEMSKRGVLA